MEHLFFSKVAMVFTFGFFGLNVHQFFTSYKHILVKIGDFKELVEETGGESDASLIGLLIYSLVPIIFLVILSKANFFEVGLYIFSVKLLLSVWLSLWIQKKILNGVDYSRKFHYIAKCDNILNLLFSLVVGYYLVFPF